MPHSINVFDQEFFDSLPSEEDLVIPHDLVVTDVLAFLKEHSCNPTLDYSVLFNALTRHGRFSLSINNERRVANRFNPAFTGANRLFCSTLTSVLPTIQTTSATRYL